MKPKAEKAVEFLWHSGRAILIWVFTKLDRFIDGIPSAIGATCRLLLVEVLLPVVLAVVRVVAALLTIFVCAWWALTGSIAFWDKQTPLIERIPIIGQFFSTEPPGPVERVLVNPGTEVQEPRLPQQTKHELPEYLLIDDKLLRYAARTAVDDNKHPEDWLTAAIANVDLALERPERQDMEDENGRKYIQLVADTRRVWKHFEVLQVPGDPPFSMTRQEWWTDNFETDSDDVKRTAERLREYLKKRGPVRVDPLLRKRYLRDKTSVFVPVNVKGMRERMCRVPGLPGTTVEYFRYPLPEEVTEENGKKVVKCKS